MVVAACLPGQVAGQTQQADPRAAELRDRLRETRWAIELQPMFGDKPDQPISDVLSFGLNEMTSQRFASKGFPASRFTVTIDDEEGPVWESTQHNPDAGIVLWQGQVHGQAVEGIVSQHPVAGDTQDFTFAGQQEVRPADERQNQPAQEAVPAHDTPPAADPQVTENATQPVTSPQQDE
ncbi:MAG: hypothetical protein L0177_03200 [Chloroflexi bacterium]|nr:hypothetical protein [Chloroflexota bacterium]